MEYESVATTQVEAREYSMPIGGGGRAAVDSLWHTDAMSRPTTPTAVYAERIARARMTMEHVGVDVLLLSVGSDLPYLTGYEAMPLERLTMLVVPSDGDATLVIPRLEAPRVVDQPGVFALRPWDETDDPVARCGPGSSSISFR
jgi:hypothetical protein